MAKTLLKNGGTGTGPTLGLAGNLTRYYTLFGGSDMDSTMSTTESSVATLFRTTGTLSNLATYVTTNTLIGTTTFVSRVGTSSGNQSISVGAGATGAFEEDSAVTDSVSAGDDWHTMVTTANVSGTVTFNSISYLFAASSNTSKRQGSVSTTMGTANATRYIAFAGSALTDTEDRVEITANGSATLKNMYLQVRSNARTLSTTTFRSRVNGANGNMAIDVLASGTGQYEDTSNSDSISSGNTINFSVTAGAGAGNLIFDSLCCDTETTDGTFYVMVALASQRAFNSATDTYVHSEGNFNGVSTTENNVKSEALMAFTASNLQCYVSTNTLDGTTTIRTRIDSSNGNQSLSVTTTATGVFEDTSATDTITASHLLNYLVSTAGTTGNIQLTNIYIMGTATPDYSKFYGYIF